MTPYSNVYVTLSIELAVPILERKMRLLVLSELAFSKIGQSVSYLDVASALKIEVSDVEKWVIDGVFHSSLLILE